MSDEQLEDMANDTIDNKVRLDLKKHDVLLVRGLDGQLGGDYGVSPDTEYVIHIRSVTDYTALARVVMKDGVFEKHLIPYNISYNTANDLNIIARIDVDMSGVKTYTELNEIIQTQMPEYLI